MIFLLARSWLFFFLTDFSSTNLASQDFIWWCQIHKCYLQLIPYLVFSPLSTSVLISTKIFCQCDMTFIPSKTQLDMFLQAQNLFLPTSFIQTTSMIAENGWKLILQITVCLEPQTVCIKEVLKYLSSIYFITHQKIVSPDWCSVSWPDDFYGHIQCLSARLV